MNLDDLTAILTILTSVYVLVGLTTSGLFWFAYKRELRKANLKLTGSFRRYIRYVRMYLPGGYCRQRFNELSAQYESQLPTSDLVAVLGDARDFRKALLLDFLTWPKEFLISIAE